MADIDDRGNIVPSPGQTFGDPIPRIHHPLEEFDNEELIYVEVTYHTMEEYMAERERVAEVIELHATTGMDLTYWYDRAVLLEDMQRQAKGTV